MSVVKGKVHPLRDNILVADMEFGEERTATGIIIQKLDGKLEGIKPRWGRVWAVGPKQKDVSIGEWICVAHGRWSRGIKVDDNGEEITIRLIDNDDILLVSDEKPDSVDVGKGM
jgi:co-chaperonin GroES (HSP10)